MMEYRDRVMIAAMQELIRQGGLSADDVAQRAEVFADAMEAKRDSKNIPVAYGGVNYDDY